MIKFNTIVFIFYSYFLSGKQAISSVYYLNSHCASGEETQVAECYEHDLLASFIELKIAEKNITTRIEKWHAMHDERLDNSVDIALKRFEESKNAFIHYRFVQCSFAQSWGGGGGVASSFRIYPCEAYLNRQRADQLNNANIANFSSTEG